MSKRSSRSQDDPGQTKCGMIMTGSLHVLGQPPPSATARHTDPIEINCHCFDPTKTVVLNLLAWQNIPDGQWGAQQQRFWRDFRGAHS